MTLGTAELRLSSREYEGAAATALRDANASTAWATPPGSPGRSPARSPASRSPPVASSPPQRGQAPASGASSTAAAASSAEDADAAYAGLCRKYGGDLSAAHLATLTRAQVEALAVELASRHTY